MSAGVVISKVILWGLGGVILVLCGTMSGFWPVILNYQLKTELVLTNDSKSYNLWKETPIPMYLEIYMFNWTNPIETLENNVKPNFLELGPYVFSEHHMKKNLTWNTNDTITFKQRRRWYFIPEMSKGTLNDEITNINVVAMTMRNLVVKYVPKKWYPVANIILKVEEKKVFVTKTVRELLFDGYSDELLNLTKKLERILKIKIPFDKFGWFYNRNDSINYDGVFNMKTGAGGLDSLGNIDRWNFNSTTTAYPGPCGKVKGSSGELWPINTAAKQHAEIFVTDICSSLKLKEDGEDVINYVKGSRFTADSLIFDNGIQDPNNMCYCSKLPCPATGARDISSCRYGAPAFISLPHFYLADPSYTANISGMFPSPELHNFHILLEKVTSIPLEVHARLQISIRSEPVPGIKFYERIPTAYIPMIWFDEKAAVTQSLASELSTLVAVATYIEPLLIGLAVLGAVMIIAGLILWRYHFFTKRDTPLLESTSS
ncbi:protein croquemort-like [Rhodnius prolixus]